MKTSIKLTNVTRESVAQPIADQLNGQTYMGLRVYCCPVGGSVDVRVGTNYDCTEAELTEMVLMVMSGIIRRTGTPVAA